MTRMPLQLVVTLALALASMSASDRPPVPRGGQVPTCKSSYPLEVCYAISTSPKAQVVISVKSLETQADYLYITGYFVEGRVTMADGSLLPFVLQLTRDDWDGFNSVNVPLPTGVATPTGIQHLNVIVRRDAENVIVY